jgi:hypothetical protein
MFRLSSDFAVPIDLESDFASRKRSEMSTFSDKNHEIIQRLSIQNQSEIGLFCSSGVENIIQVKTFGHLPLIWQSMLMDLWNVYKFIILCIDMLQGMAKFVAKESWTHFCFERKGNWPLKRL